MADFYKMSFKYGVAGYATIETRETLDVRFFRGLKLQESFPPTTVRLRTRPNPPDCIGVGSLDLVSERFKTILIDEGANAEFLEVEVTQQGNPISTRYYEMNILEVRECLDYERSVVEYFTYSPSAGILAIEELYLDEQKVGTSRLFLLEEKPLILVRDDLVEVLHRAKLKGLEFAELPTLWPPSSMKWRSKAGKR